MKKFFTLTIGWLYPDLMSIYGDRGNIIVLQKRCQWRGINVEIRKIDQTTSYKLLATCDLLMMGGAQDSQQTIVAKDLEKKKTTLSEMIESGMPGLYVCGGFQFLGRYYKEADGTVIKQLGILDVYTENPGGKRLIGNIAIEVNDVISNEVRNLQEPSTSSGKKFSLSERSESKDLVFLGFENHGGRTRLGPSVKPLGKVLKGYGSNAEDGTEGAVYKNTIGTYFHGPILPKNPELADWLILKALEHKYDISSSSEQSESRSKDNSQPIRQAQGKQARTITLSPLDDSLSQKAKKIVLKNLGVRI